MGWKKKREEDAAKYVAAKTEAEAAVPAELESLWLPADFMVDMDPDHILTQQSESDFLTPVDTLSSKTNTDDSPMDECRDDDQLCCALNESQSLSQVNTEEMNNSLTFCSVLRHTTKERSNGDTSLGASIIDVTALKTCPLPLQPTFELQ